MPLVDYTSDSEPETETLQPSSSNPLPPLPPTFHDLYAHTVRTSTTDDPTLHQGRRRQIPHMAGQWPSHIYVEWHPSPDEHALLESFLTKLRSKLGGDIDMPGFLTNDVGVPLPLHISLSRPFVLSTEQRDGFLADVRDRIERCRTPAFTLRVTGVKWHRTGESGRSFLVLRVGSRDVGAADEGDDEGEKDDKDDDEDPNPNPELTVFLMRCNTAVEKYGGPKLYEWADGRRVGDAFHLSIAWSFAEPDEKLKRRTAEIFGEKEFAEGLEGLEVPVNGIKVKIGNVVTNIGLKGAKR